MSELNARTGDVQDFGLTIDIDSLIKQYDADGSGEIDYEEFREMLS